MKLLKRDPIHPILVARATHWLLEQGLIDNSEEILHVRGIGFLNPTTLSSSSSISYRGYRLSQEGYPLLTLHEWISLSLALLKESGYQLENPNAGYSKLEKIPEK